MLKTILSSKQKYDEVMTALLYVKTRAPCPKCGKINNKGIRVNMNIIERTCSTCKVKWHTVK